jgi:hypothetical protein
LPSGNHLLTWKKMPDMSREFLFRLDKSWQPAKKKPAASLLKSSAADGCSAMAVFGPRLIHPEVWSRDALLLQTASRRSCLVDMIGRYCLGRTFCLDHTVLRFIIYEARPNSPYILVRWTCICPSDKNVLMLSVVGFRLSTIQLYV